MTNSRRTIGPARWHLTLFGGWALAGADVRLHHREQRLVAYLALNGPATRPVTAGALWPETTEAHALSNLRTAVRHTKAACPGLLADDLASLDLDGQTLVDVREFRGMVDEPRVPDRDQARFLLGASDLLPGWYEDWVLFEHERLSQQRILRLEEYADSALAAGELPLALALAQRAATLDPLRESAQRTLIRVHLAMGNRIEALRIYHDFAARGQREYGIGPSALLTELMEPLLLERDASPIARRARAASPRPPEKQ